MSDTTSTEKAEHSHVASLALVSLLFLPFVVEYLVLKYFDEPGTGWLWYPMSYTITTICALGASFGVARLFSLAGITKILTIFILFPILGYGCYHVSRFAVLLIFMPRH